MRINGQMIPLKIPALSAEQVKSLLYSIMTESKRSDYEQHLELDFAVQFGNNMRFRVNAFNTINGAAAAFRAIPTKILTLEDLKLEQMLGPLATISKGLVLVTGATGSGKSTSLAAIIDKINTRYSKHVITVEDPVEFVHQSKNSLINQREVGEHTNSFSKALKSALREDPDVILVGELRDIETIQLALTAAETGHLVFGTLHTSSAAKTIDRVIDVFPAGDKPLIRSMLSTSLEAIIAQKLLPTINNRSRVAALEILLGTASIRNLIREGKVHQIPSVMQINTKLGMRTMKDSVYELLANGVIGRNVAKNALNIFNDEEFEKGIDNRSIGDNPNQDYSGNAGKNSAKNAPPPRRNSGYNVTDDF
jgi:twitching motility protein PilT